MNGRCAEAPVYQVSTFRYMTFEEIACAVNCTPQRVHSLVRRNGWRVHLDRIGRPRARVPESMLDAALPLVAKPSASHELASAHSLAARTEPSVTQEPVGRSQGPQPERSMSTHHVHAPLQLTAMRRDPERDGLIALCSIVGFSFSLLFALTIFAKALPGL